MTTYLTTFRGALLNLRPGLTALFLALTSAFLFVAPAVARPNIVVIMVDDLDVSVWDEALKLGVLPNIQTMLIDQGTTFKQMFTSQPLCCPSRATFHTGQYPQNHGVTGNDHTGPDEEGLYDQFKEAGEKRALGTWLKQTGPDGTTYRTGHFGKYMNGSGWDPKHVPPGWDVWRALIPKTPVQCMYGYTLSNSGGDPETFGGTESEFQTDKLAELAVTFIGAPDSRPFLLVVAPTAPHTEGCRPAYQDPDHQIRTAPRYVDQTSQVVMPAGTLPSYGEADMSDKPAWMQARPPFGSGGLKGRTKLFNDKIAALRPVDDMVKRVMDALKAQSKTSGRGNLVIFTSDNGYQYGTHRLSGKEDFYEESVRVPMVVRKPGPPASHTQQTWVMNNDWAPTIADYAEVKPLIKVDGRSFRPLLGSSTATNARQTMLIRTGDNPVPAAVHSAAAAPSHYSYLAVRTKKAALTGDSTGNTILVYAQTYNTNGTLHAEELYDLAVDQYQEESLHGSTDPARLDQITRLKQRLKDLKTCSGPSCRQLENN